MLYTVFVTGRCCRKCVRCCRRISRGRCWTTSERSARRDGGNVSRHRCPRRHPRRRPCAAGHRQTNWPASTGRRPNCRTPLPRPPTKATATERVARGRPMRARWWPRFGRPGADSPCRPLWSTTRRSTSLHSPWPLCRPSTRRASRICAWRPKTGSVCMAGIRLRNLSNLGAKKSPRWCSEMVRRANIFVICV